MSCRIDVCSWSTAAGWREHSDYLRRVYGHPDAATTVERVLEL
jgi:hypothetical protein